jgi:hypothetical protein
LAAGVLALPLQATCISANGMSKRRVRRLIIDREFAAKPGVGHAEKAQLTAV